MISTTTMTRAARVVLQGYLTAAFFKEIVVDRTILVVSKSEKVSVSLVTSTVCSSTAVLLLATAKAARQFLSDDFQRVPALEDVGDTAEPNAPFAGENVTDVITTAKAFGASAQPSSSHIVIESTESTFDGPTKGLSAIDSDMTLIARDEDLARDVFSGDRVSDTTDLESLADESTFYEDNCQATIYCLTDDEPEHTLHVKYDSHTTIDNLIRQMSVLSLDNVPSHFSTLSLDNVSSHFSSPSLDDVPSPISSPSLDDIPSHILTLSLDDVPSPISTPSLDDVPSPISTLSLDDVPSHISALSLDDLPSHLSTVSLDNVPPHLSTLSLDNVLSHLSTQASELRSTHTLHNHTTRIANIPGTPPDNGSPQSSK
ncbi:hypothetical protein EDB19DRAFT_1377854 [Suillus lakei]|nr:hypothetical protein EDB19DRAFT_1377854 [Suillus lakei]